MVVHGSPTLYSRSDSDARLTLQEVQRRDLAVEFHKITLLRRWVAMSFGSSGHDDPVPYTGRRIGTTAEPLPAEGPIYTDRGRESERERERERERASGREREREK